MNDAVSDRHSSQAEHRAISLPGGQLDLFVERCHGKLDDLIGFAARANPRRAFLFLSKVLGKHYPSRPSSMAAVHEHLAGSVPAAPGPIVFVGMAETATGLGQGVFEAWLQANRGAKVLYLQTTRYRIEQADCLAFEESHSHAPRVFLHLPQNSAERDLLQTARQVVLIDDELSTGNTFVNLVKVLRGVMPRLDKVHLATICDFMGEARRTVLGAEMGLACTIGALVSGHWRFTPNGEKIQAGAAAQCTAGNEVRLADAGYGRLGRTQPLELPAALIASLGAEMLQGPTLVLGTGEFMHAAFVLGRALEARGVNVYVQSTTRSPIRTWGDVKFMRIASDPYGEGVQNYLYNVGFRQYDRVLICHETPNGPALHALAAPLFGRLIQFKLNDDVKEIPVR